MSCNPNKKNNTQSIAYAGGLVTLLSSLQLLAAQQDPPPPGDTNAGQILQQIERDIEIKPLPVQPTFEEPTPEPEDQGPKVTIKEFKFEGNQLISEAELQGALESLTSREISISELKSAPDLVAAFYRERGYIATASLPEQDITEGVVLIKVVEAVFSEVKVDGEFGKDYKRIRPSVVERVVEAHHPKGQPLNQNLIDQAISVLKRFAGFIATPTYKAGRAEGTTDLVVGIQDKPLVSGSFMADNTGGRSTGRDKQVATLSLASPFALGDSANLTYMSSKGVSYGRVAYSVPVGSHGMQVGVNGSYLAYDVVIKDNGLDEVDPKGNSKVYGFDLKQPLYTTRTTNLNLELNYDRKAFTNKRKGQQGYEEVSDYKVNVASIVLSASHNDSFLAGAVNNFSIDYGYGHVNMDGAPLENQIEPDRDGPRTRGYFQRTKLNLSRDQFITDTVVLSLSGSQQWANRNLDASEKFYLGGINGVRAYPTSEGAGSEGYLFKAELRKYLPYNFNASLFIDEGRVRQYYDEKTSTGDLNAGLDEDHPNAYRLRGYGATIGWNGPYNSSIKATYATRISDNPNPSGDNNNLDQDGSLKRHVLWLSGSIAF